MPLVEGGHKILNKVREKVIVEIQHYTHRSKKKKKRKDFIVCNDIDIN